MAKHYQIPIWLSGFPSSELTNYDLFETPGILVCGKVGIHEGAVTLFRDRMSWWASSCNGYIYLIYSNSKY